MEDTVQFSIIDMINSQFDNGDALFCGPGDYEEMEKIGENSVALDYLCEKIRTGKKTHFALEGQEITDNVLKKLVSAFKHVKVERLDLKWNGPFEEESEGLKALFDYLTEPAAEKLQELDLSGTKFSTKSLALFSDAMKKNKSLKTISLDCCCFGAESIKAFCQFFPSNTTLRELDLRDTAFLDEDTISVLCEALSQQIGIKHLFLNFSCNVPETTTKFDNNSPIPNPSSLFVGLLHNTTLKQLNLNNCDFSENSTEIIGSVLKVNKTLTHLDLSENGLNPNEIVRIGEGLQENTSLKYLNLTINHVQKGVSSLASALRVNKSLQCLVLGASEIDEDGAKDLFDSLTLNSSLQELFFYGNGISGEDVGKSIKKLLQNNNTLEKLDLGQNIFCEEALFQIFEGIKYNKALQYLDLSENQLNEKLAPFFMEALSANDTLEFFAIESDENSHDIQKALLRTAACNTSLSPDCGNLRGCSERVDEASVKFLQRNDHFRGSKRIISKTFVGHDPNKNESYRDVQIFFEME